MKLYVILFCCIIFGFSSCVTTYDLEYLRNNKESGSFQRSAYTYNLKPGDLLSVQISTTTEQQHDFFNQEQTSNSQLMMQNPYLYGYLIKEDGFLDLPSFGRVKAAGFTLSELENIIKQIAISYFEQPVVKLNIINFEVTVLGEVNNPGTFKIVNPEENILYALGLSGDITPFGDRKKIKIIRKQKDNNQVFYVDLTKQSLLYDNKFILHPNDIIYIPPMKKKFYAINNITNAVSLLLSTITIYLLINN